MFTCTYMNCNANKMLCFLGNATRQAPRVSYPHPYGWPPPRDAFINTLAPKATNPCHTPLAAIVGTDMPDCITTQSRSDLQTLLRIHACHPLHRHMTEVNFRPNPSSHWLGTRQAQQISHAICQLAWGTHRFPTLHGIGHSTNLSAEVSRVLMGSCSIF